MRLFTLIAACLLITACGHAPENLAAQGSANERLQPFTGTIGAGWKQGRSYVPVYSSLPWGNVFVDLAATVSIRNVTLARDVVIESVDYYGSDGKRLRRYVEAPSRLPAMASVEYIILMQDRAGGPGANFLIEWAIPTDGEEPLIEAVMVGQHGNAGISFTSPGRSTLRTK